MSEQSLFERIGGEQAVKAAVNLFYKKNMLDARIRHFFLEIDLDQLKGHQVMFLTYAFGGIKHYGGKSMREAHKRLVDELGLNESHFAAVAENLQSTLEELDVAEDLIAEVMAIAASTKDDVLNL